MKQFNGYDDAKKNASVNATEKLPAGCYVGKIMGVRYDEGKNGNSDMITLQLDIAEGEQKDFFRKQYEANADENKKWKGKTIVYVPTDDGSVRDGWTKNAFAKWTNSIEQSNPGYSWDWDENKWKGKMVGLAYRNAFKNIEGKDIQYTEIAFPCEVQKVRDGKVPMPKDKIYKGYGSSTKSSVDTEDFVSVPNDSPEDIPF